MVANARDGRARSGATSEPVEERMRVARGFIAPGSLDKRLSRIICMLLESRPAADYQGVPTFSREEAEEHPDRVLAGA